MRPEPRYDQETPRRKKRAAYRKPRILSREKLEIVAVACSPGKAAGQGGDCFNFVNS